MHIVNPQVYQVLWVRNEAQTSMDFFFVEIYKTKKKQKVSHSGNHTGKAGRDEVRPDRTRLSRAGHEGYIQ